MGREKLLVEKKAEELVAEIARLNKKIRYPSNASKHVVNASDSAYFNIGEGVAVFKQKKKAEKYDIARCEAKEAQRGLEALVLQGKLTRADINRAYSLADEIIAMLTTMIKNLESRM